MKKIIAIIDCSIPINSRNQKIINSIKSYYPEYEIHVITWNREGLTLKEKGNFHAYYCIAPYADAKAKISGMFGYKKYIQKHSIRFIQISSLHRIGAILFSLLAQKLKDKNLFMKT